MCLLWATQGRPYKFLVPVLCLAKACGEHSASFFFGARVAK